jgi:hypothetical protein
MATENIRVTHPVEVQNDAKARVALDLMDRIFQWEEGKNAEKKKRDYWLTLYAQCYRAANGVGLKHVLERE